MKYTLFETLVCPVYFGVSVIIESDSEKEYLVNMKNWCDTRGFASIHEYFYFENIEDRVEFMLHWL